MNILSLYDGMACGMLALQDAGIPVDRYVAYEIDKYAIQTSTHNFPMIEQRGDVFGADFTEFEGFDMVLAGFPCTKFSIAQTTDRETKPYSGPGWELFEQAWRAVCEAKPAYFLFENNKSMAEAVRDEISKIIGFQPICINSALVSAQSRKRIYWVGKRTPAGTYIQVPIQQPEDLGILMRDVLDNGMAYQEKANCLCGNRGRGSLPHDLEKRKHNYAAEPCRIGTWPNKAKNQRHDSQQYRIYDTEAKGVTLCGNGGGMGAKTGLYAIPVEFEGDIPIMAQSGTDGKIYPVYKVEGGMVTMKGQQYPIKLPDGYYIIRKLTVSECKRLQTVPDWYEFPVSATQAYRMLGNGWTVKVIAHLLVAIKLTAGEHKYYEKE